jgi:ABC-type sugar transport system ATPase subunit
VKKTIKIFNIILVLLLTVILVGCETKKNNSIPSTIPTVTDITPSSSEDVDGVYKINYRTYENQLYHEFWDVNSHIEFKIDILESELALIQTDYDYYSSIGSKSPIYRKADVTIILNGKEYFYEEVGIRMKGNTSRRDFYDPIDGVYAMIHYKLAFNQTFDDESEYDSPKVWNDPNLRKQRKDRMFAGMDKLNLKWNKNFDETFSKESWAFNMFEEFGVLAPKVTPSRVQLQYRGQYENMGIFFVNENVDKYFLEKRLDEKHLDGDLDLERIKNVLEKVGLKKHQDKKVKKYSLGMKQKLYFAYTILRSPKYLLLDEPFVSVDPKSVKTFKQCIEILKNQGSTIIIASHDVNEVLDIADYLCVIKDGEVVYHGDKVKIEELEKLYDYEKEADQ